MKLVDSNVLIYAVNSSLRQHQPAFRWLTNALSGSETVGLPWTSLLAFIRVSTNPRVFATPISVEDALSTSQRWLTSPAAVVVEPSIRHLSMLGELLTVAGTAGNLTSDAHLAALAREHGADVVTFDRDFERFGVTVVVPSCR